MTTRHARIVMWESGPWWDWKCSCGVVGIALSNGAPIARGVLDWTERRD